MYQKINTVIGVQVTTKDGVEIFKGHCVVDCTGDGDVAAYAGVPEIVGRLITEKLSIPVVGIGAGSYTDGQLLIYADLLGLYDIFTPKFVKRYANIGAEMEKAFREYCEDVRSGRFPEDGLHTYKIDPEERRRIEELFGAAVRRAKGAAAKNGSPFHG